MIGIIFSKNKWLGLLSAAVGFAFLPPTVAAAAEVVGVRFGVTSPTETRLVFDSKGLPEYQLESSSAGSGTVSVIFSKSSAVRMARPSGKGAGHVASYASGVEESGQSTVNFILSRNAKVKEAFVIAPSSSNSNHRLVIDLISAPVSELAASLPARKFEDIAAMIAAVAPPSSAADESITSAPLPPTLAPQNPTAVAVLANRPVIVIDAGHGGTDPGAAGPGGSKESAATLTAALMLAEILRETGRYEVVLTRDEDVRLAHEERSRIARDAKADLFISLHADAHSESNVRGGSVYTLSDEGTERSAREALAKGDYYVFDLDIGEADREVGGILYNLAQRRTANESDKFAELLISRLAGVTPLLNNTHRRGNFKVLLAPDVPAVLLELAFISNRHDEANLLSPSWRKKSMGAAAAAIDAYFIQRNASKHASNVTGATAR